MMCTDPTPTPPGFCTATALPRAGLRRYDVRQPDADAHSVGFTGNDDCEPPQVCVDHMCVDPTPTRTPIGFCTGNDDCPPPQVCVDMMCSEPSPTPTVRSGGGGGGCSCKVDPREPRPGSLDAWAMALPALMLVLRRRVRRGSSV
jgi:MYXO-CTERM domain-containing protein